MANTPETEGVGVSAEKAARSVVAPVVTCTACNGQNAFDSRFCRHCGAEFSAAAPSAEATSSAPPATVPVPLASASSTSSAEGAVRGGAADVDERRARQLLDRAFLMAERGDRPGAILACRQSISLAPTSPQGYSMLGLLLERSGDLEGAAAAYARVLQLAPDSRLEQESLARLQATLSKRSSASAAFHFDDQELFAETSASAGAAEATPFDRTGDSIAPVGASALGGAPAAYPDGPAPALGGVSASSALLGGTGQSPAAPDLDLSPAARAPMMQRIAARPTYFFRGLPLVAVAGTSLLFMTWARNAAVSRQAILPPVAGVVDPGTSSSSGPGQGSIDPASAPSTSAASTSASASGGVPNVPGVALESPPPANVAGPNDRFPVSNRRVAAPAGQSGAAAPNRAGAQGGQRRVVNAPVNAPVNRNVSEPSRPTPSFPAVSRPVQPQVLAPARIESAPVAPPVPSLPQPSIPSGAASSGASSSGGGPVNTTGSNSQGYITLSRPRNPSAAQPRPSNRGTEAERAAARESRAGRSGSAITTINEAIRTGNGGDTGWRYQQRALLFLEQGDYQRAADDFQVAINSYRDQVRRGERVNEAQSGIQACRSGLNLALANLRR